jgi:hypothetical protein
MLPNTPRKASYSWRAKPPPTYILSKLHKSLYPIISVVGEQGNKREISNNNENGIRACSFGLVAGADLFREKSTAGWWLLNKPCEQGERE